MSTQTAQELGISDGDVVTLETPRGSIRIKMTVTSNIHPGIVSVPHGWREANVNLLTNDVDVDPVTGFIGFKSVLCRVTRD